MQISIYRNSAFDVHGAFSIDTGCVTPCHHSWPITSSEIVKGISELANHISLLTNSLQTNVSFHYPSTRNFLRASQHSESRASPLGVICSRKSSSSQLNPPRNNDIRPATILVSEGVVEVCACEPRSVLEAPRCMHCDGWCRGCVNWLPA